MTFPSSVRDQALVNCGRCCCICHRFSGTKIEIYHIKHKSEGGDDTLENCIPLCFSCQADQTSYDHKHPKGTKYSRNELIAHRDAWFKKVTGQTAILGPAELKGVDKEVLDWIRKSLAWEDSISYMTYIDIGDMPFEPSRLDSFYDFIFNSQDPSRCFLDSDLESLKADLCQKLELFTRCVDAHTNIIEGSRFYRISQEIRDGNPKLYEEIADKICDARLEALEAYRTLIDSARRRIGTP